MGKGLINVVQDKIWAIRTGKLEEINAYIEARLKKPEQIKALDFEAKQANAKPEYVYDYDVLENGTAVISVVGPISKRFNMLQAACGGVSTELLQNTIHKALADEKVNSLILDIESPGGEVDGTKELADFIYNSRGEKPIIAFCNGMMCSAAYWIGSAADKIVTTETGIIGHIGVVSAHYDISKAREMEGVKVTEIYAGKYKRIASSEKPLTAEGKEHLQNMVDDIYAIFVDSVARNRGVSVDEALKMADGKEYLGINALKVGLADKLGTLETAVSLANKRSFKKMDIAILEKEQPDLVALIKEIGKEEAEKSSKQHIETAVIAERNRVVEILEANGDREATIEAIKNGTSASEAYKAFYFAEKNKKSAGLKALAQEATEPVTVSEPIIAQTTYNGEIEKLIASGMNRAEAVIEVNKRNPSLLSEYLKKEQK